MGNCASCIIPSISNVRRKLKDRRRNKYMTEKLHFTYDSSDTEWLMTSVEGEGAGDMDIGIRDPTSLTTVTSASNSINQIHSDIEEKSLDLVFNPHKKFSHESSTAGIGIDIDIANGNLIDLQKLQKLNVVNDAQDNSKATVVKDKDYLHKDQNLNIPQLNANYKASKKSNFNAKRKNAKANSFFTNDDELPLVSLTSDPEDSWSDSDTVVLPPINVKQKENDVQSPGTSYDLVDLDSSGQTGHDDEYQKRNYNNNLTNSKLTYFNDINNNHVNSQSQSQTMNMNPLSNKKETNLINCSSNIPNSNTTTTIYRSNSNLTISYHQDEDKDKEQEYKTSHNQSRSQSSSKSTSNSKITKSYFNSKFAKKQKKFDCDYLQEEEEEEGEDEDEDLFTKFSNTNNDEKLKLLKYDGNRRKSTSNNEKNNHKKDDASSPTPKMKFYDFDFKLLSRQ